MMSEGIVIVAVFVLLDDVRRMKMLRLSEVIIELVK